MNKSGADKKPQYEALRVRHERAFYPLLSSSFVSVFLKLKTILSQISGYQEQLKYQV